MRRIIISLLAAALLLACVPGCSRTVEEPEPTAVVSQPMIVEEETPAPVETEAPTPTPEPTPEPLSDLINPLTGEPVEEEILQNRPFIVMVNNIIVAQPQEGISKADMIYELMEEGGITRMMAFFTDIDAAEKIGSIRSARIYNVSVVNAYDGIFVHAGGSDEALTWIDTHEFTNINALVHEGGSAFYRDGSRQSHGVEHSLFGVGAGIHALAEELGSRMEHKEDYDNRFGLSFSATAEEQCTGDANYINVRYAGGKTTNFTYHEDTGLYTAEQFGSVYADDGKIPVEFKNVLVINADTSLQGDGLHLSITLSGTSGNGYFACGGKYVPIQWSRKNQADNFHYTTMDGEPLSLGIGKTFVAVQQIGGYAGETEFLG